jgi:glycerol dehydrogenase
MNKQLFPGYTIGNDAYDNIPAVCGIYGTKAAIIGGKRALGAAADKIRRGAAAGGITISGEYHYGGEASRENVDRLKEEPGIREAELIFAVGGGKAIDTAKVLAQSTNRPLFTFPTIASTCAAATGLAAIYHPNGALREYSPSEIPPVHIFINSEIIAAAPVKYFWAGIGDSMAKHHECTISSRGDELAYSNAMGEALSVMCAGPLLKYGEKALADCTAHTVSTALEEVILGIVVTTGLVSNCVDIDHTSGLAHAVYNGFTVLPQIEKYGHLHGEVVSYGILILLLVDGQEEELKRVFTFNKKIGLPTELADIHSTTDDLDKLITKALTGMDVRHYPYVVTPSMLHKAFLDLEEYNRNA